jgi:hypothetical protein
MLEEPPPPDWEAGMAKVDEGCSVRKAAFQIGVTKSSLQRRLDARKAGKVVSDKPGRTPVLSAAEEQALCDTMLSLAEGGRGFTTADLQRIVMLITIDRHVPWDRKAGPSKTWVKKYLGRHPQLSLRRSSLHDAVRRASDIQAVLQEYMANVGKIIRNYQPTHIWSCDESGTCASRRMYCCSAACTSTLRVTAHTHTLALTLPLPSTTASQLPGYMCRGTNPPRVIAAKGAKHVPALRSPSRENVSLLVAINAAGSARAPMVVYKGVLASAEWVSGLPDDWLVTTTASSVVNTDVFYQWMEQFCTDLPEGEHLLFYDGHVSHVSLETVQLAQDNNVTCFLLPAHTTHNTQPLDLCCFGVMKQHYRARAADVPHPQPQPHAQQERHRRAHRRRLRARHDARDHPGVLQDCWPGALRPQRGAAARQRRLRAQGQDVR